MTTISVIEAQAQLIAIVDSVADSHDRVTLTRAGKPAVVLMSVDDLDSIEETLHWQTQPNIGDDASAARDERERGELWDEAAVRRRYGVRRA